MQQYKITQAFAGSPDGACVIDYERGDIVPSTEKPWSDDLATVALRNRWARKHAPPKTETKKAADSRGEQTDGVAADAGVQRSD